MVEESWDDEEFRRKWQEQSEKIGRFNLAVFGKTGVGKSTLINAVFGRDVAKTGIGEPVTTEKLLHLHDNGILGILDGPGLEIGQDSDAIIKDLAQYVRGMRKKPQSEQLHVAWYCIRASDRRFEDTEADFIRRLHELGLPVVVVLTQVASRDGVLEPDALTLAEHIASLDLPIEGGRPLAVMTAENDFTRMPAHGLRELLDATFRAAPEGVRIALIAAQKVDLDRKFRQAQLRILAAGALAGGASVFLKKDPKALLSVVIGMTAEIARVYGIPQDVAAAAWTAAGTVTSVGGKKVTESLLTLVPADNISAQDAITAAVAGAFVVAVGYSWTYVCAQIVQGKLDGISSILQDGMVREIFVSQFKSKFTPPSPSV